MKLFITQLSYVLPLHLQTHRYFPHIQTEVSYVKYKKNHCLDKSLLHVHKLSFASSTAPGTTGESRLQICQAASFTRDYLYSDLRLQLQECTMTDLVLISELKCLINN